MDKLREVAFYLDEARPYLVRPNPSHLSAVRPACGGQAGKWTQGAKPWRIPSFWKTRGRKSERFKKKLKN
jgi:hypothetical protein